MSRGAVVGGFVAICLISGCLRFGYDAGPGDAGGTDHPPGAPPDAGGPPDAGRTCSPENWTDADADGVCDDEDRCAGADDKADRDDDGVPDSCDPMRCGNGSLDVGETCDPSSGDAPCPESCPAQACEAGVLRGSPQACNVECATTPITTPADGDRCCPAGADATSDSDCQPICGNRVREPGEACDGEDLCNVDCSWTREYECLQFSGTATEACKQCRCASCTEELITCFSPEAGFSQYCPPIVNCGDLARCFGDDCYCGDSTSCASPNGPCRAEVDAAAQAADEQPGSCLGSLSCAGYHASAIGACETERCNAECVQ